MFSRRDLLVSVAAFGAAAAASSRLLAAPPGRRVFEIPIELTAGRLVIACTIGGHGPYLFAIDTGGTVSLIRSDIANELGLRAAGHSALGVGGRPDSYMLYDADEVTFGNSLRQNRVVFAGVDHIRFGKDVMGSLAAGCLTAFDSEIDFRDRLWRVYPDGAPSRQGWVSQDNAIVNDGPAGGSSYLFGRAQLGARPLRCLLDTGAPGWLRLCGDAAHRSGLLRANQNWSPVGKFGAGSARLVRSEEVLTFGGLSIPRPLVLVQDESKNRLTDELIGLPVLQQLDIATDVKSRQLLTRPNGLGGPPERYNRSGLWIDQRGGQLFAGAVGKGSPAEQAGIAIGDRIDGMDFEQLIRRLNGNAGEQVSFDASRGGARRNVMLTLTNYL